MKKTLRTPSVDQLFAAILNLKTEDECYAFFEDLCTVNELHSLAQRFDVGVRLLDRQTYQEISKATGASTATISRVRRLLEDGDTGLETAAARLKEEAGADRE